MAGLLNVFEIKINDAESINTRNFQAFYLRSTAQIFVEDQEEEDLQKLGFIKLRSNTTLFTWLFAQRIDALSGAIFLKNALNGRVYQDHKKSSQKIKNIVDSLIKKAAGDLNKVHIILQIHGYNTSEEEFYATCRKTAATIKKIHDQSSDILLFLGYRWPSEKMSRNSLLATTSRSILPLWLQYCGSIGIIRLIIDLWNYVSGKVIHVFDVHYYIDFLKISDTSDWDIRLLFTIIVLLLFRFTSILAIAIMTLIAMRASGYFQDSYRAVNHGVLDLVQFFRVLDYWIRQDPRFTKVDSNNENRIKLSFVAHSMGGFVTTNLIRILSDVFDNKNDANTLSVVDEENQSFESISPHIGSFFELNRMVLVSPDIPVNTILLERSNFLGSSLIRFQESYLFSNQADMVLLLFSTVANYLSFSSRTPQMGYRLGNIGVHNHINQKWWRPIATRFKLLITIFSSNHKSTIDYSKYQEKRFDLISIQQPISTACPFSALEYLIIGVQHTKLFIRGREKIQKQPFLAQKFTYFDCTDYLRRKAKIIKTSRELEVLDLFDYLILVFQHSFTHGGYFDSKKCPETHEAIYRIVCQGFDEFSTTKTGREIIKGQHEIKVLRSI
jgi:Putative serine esterase (DUF676)